MPFVSCGLLLFILTFSLLRLIESLFSYIHWLPLGCDVQLTGEANGGGLYVLSTISILLQDSVLKFNTAGQDGGGAYFQGCVTAV